MTGGFAFVAYPAEYAACGVMTFVMGPTGTIFEKNLDKDTATTAKAMIAYDPDSSWKIAR